MVAMREAFGTARTAAAMRITDVGLRGGERRLKVRNSEAYLAAMKAGERLAQEQEGKAA
jgi:hypothetical protein